MSNIFNKTYSDIMDHLTVEAVTKKKDRDVFKNAKANDSKKEKKEKQEKQEEKLKNNLPEESQGKPKEPININVKVTYNGQPI